MTIYFVFRLTDNKCDENPIDYKHLVKSVGNKFVFSLRAFELSTNSSGQRLIVTVKVCIIRLDCWNFNIIRHINPLLLDVIYDKPEGVGRGFIHYHINHERDYML